MRSPLVVLAKSQATFRNAVVLLSKHEQFNSDGKKRIRVGEKRAPTQAIG